jgi:hypothetical protein
LKKRTKKLLLLLPPYTAAFAICARQQGAKVFASFFKKKRFLAYRKLSLGLPSAAWYPGRMAAQHRAAWLLVLLALPCGAAATPSLEGDGLAAALSLPLRKPFGTRADWHVTAYQAPGDEGRFGEIPARICFLRGAGAPEGCVSLMRAATNDAARMAYQTVTGLSVTPLLRAPAVSAVVAQAEMSYGASGTSEQYALWSYRSSTDTFEPLATFQVSDQGEFLIVDDGKLAGCVVTADYLLAPGETHFGRHRFAIAVHKLNPVTMTYSEVLRYVTLSRYPSLDEGGVDVMAQTLRILRYVYPRQFD